MRLLIATQVVDKNDSNLGFFHRWIEEFAKKFDSVVVICLQEGEHMFPANVSVYSLGKEKRSASRLTYARRFRKLIREHVNEYDAVFVHMNPEYVLLGGFFWRKHGKKIALWYVHKNITWTLRIAEQLVELIFTASQESFRILSPKVRIMGHGIDTSLFAGLVRAPAHGALRLLTLGRITASKHIILMLDICDGLAARGRDFLFLIVGAPLTKDDAVYVAELKDAINRRPYKDRINLAGAVSHNKIPETFASADVFINLSTTGSMDKAVLEALAAGVPVVTGNDAYASVAVAHFVPSANPTLFADAIEMAVHDDPRPLQEYVERYHSLPRLIERIAKELS